MSVYVTRTIELAADEAITIRQISAAEHLPEDFLLKKFVLDSIASYRRQQAIQAYRRGELDLSRAARYADISVYEMMDELRRQGIPLNRSVDKFLDGLEGFVEDFGDGEVLRQAIARLREQPELLAVLGDRPAM
jgi:predicted HTH domain antitoxin